MNHNGRLLTTRMGKRNGANNDFAVSGNNNEDAIMLGSEFWLPEKTARDLEYKMQDLQDYMARYYDNSRSKDFLRL